MMKDNNVAMVSWLFAGAAIVGYVSIVATVAYVAVHFILKFW